MRRVLSILLPALVVAVALVIGSQRSADPATDAERAQAIAGTVRCPTCRGQSVASSDAPAAVEIRQEIDRQVAAGESEGEVQAALVAAYGDGILLNPPGSGVAGLVWVLPVAGLVVAAGALALAFRRWRPAAAAGVTDEDRRLVEAARRRRQDPEV